MSLLERHEVEAFLTLAEELHFGRTAERLHVTTGRISQTIKKVERRVGAPLFERTSRNVTLTPLGRQLHDELRPARERIEAALRRAADTAYGIGGLLRIGFSSPWCGDLMVRAADAFLAGHPECEVEIQEVQLCDPLGPLRAGVLDLQLTEFPIDEPDIVTGPVIVSEPRVLLVPAQHPFARQASVSLEDLAEASLVTLRGDVPRYWLDFHLPPRTPSGRRVPHGPAVAYWQEAMSLVATGKGVMVAAAAAASHHARPGVVFVPFNDAPPIDYGLLWPTTQETPRVRAFLKALHTLHPAPRLT